MSKTETALQALVAALLDASEEDDAALPAPLRNEALPARLLQPSPGDPQLYLNVWDGEGGPANEFLGADVIDDGYEIEHRPVIEWIVAGGTTEAREAAFDAGLEAIHDALKRANDGSYLGGAVDSAGIESITRGGKGLVTDGLPNIKAAEITPVLTFVSSRPF